MEERSGNGGENEEFCRGANKSTGRMAVMETNTDGTSEMK